MPALLESRGEPGASSPPRTRRAPGAPRLSADGHALEARVGQSAEPPTASLLAAEQGEGRESVVEIVQALGDYDSGLSEEGAGHGVVAGDARRVAGAGGRARGASSRAVDDAPLGPWRVMRPQARRTFAPSRGLKPSM